MDRRFDFSALLRMQTHENKHKVKPTQFISVAGGVSKRVESNIEKKKKTRLTNFDNFRNLTQCEPPVQEPLTKLQQRMLQLQKWKEEKERRKKEAMTNKKKPFVVGIPRSTLKFELPPPIAWPLPSTSGRVTRSQTSHISNKQEKIYTFAPKNAAFNPTLKDLEIPSLSIFGQEKLEPHKKQISKIKSPNVPRSDAQEARCLRSRSKVTDKIEDKKTQNPSTASHATEKNTTKKKLAKKPLKEVNTVKSKAFSSPTASCTYDSHEQCVKKMSTRKGKKSGQTPRKDENFMIIPSTSNTKLVDISNDSINMETDFEKPSNIRRTSTPNTVTPNRIKSTIIEDFITFTPKNPVPKSESSSEEKLRSPKAMDVPMTPQQIEEEAKKISPRVCLSRGKDNMRIEMKKRIDEGLLDPDVCDMSVEHFRRQLDMEIMRMTEMCETWDKILEKMTLPDEIQEAVLSAVGQARLLMTQKFQQFASLLRQSENPEPGHQLITTADLQGFWDMVFLQVENVDIRFKKLEEARARGWSVEQQPAASARRRKPPQSRPAASVRPAPSSRLKDIIAAARKAKQASTNEDTKTFDAGFFSVQSPVKAVARPAAATPLRQPSLLQSVLSSEAKKASAKNLCAVLRASMIGKSVDSENQSPYEANLVTPINLGLTPGKSILKSNNNTSTKVTSKQLHFAVMSSSDTASDSSPVRDDGQISGVNYLDPVIISPKLDSDNPQCTSPTTHNIEKDHLQMSDALADDDKKVNFEVKENRRSSRRGLRNAEGNSGKTDTEYMAEGKRNRRSSRGLRNAEGNSVTTNEEKMAEDEENNTDEENMAEDKGNRRTSRRGLRNAEGNSVKTDTEYMAEGKRNRRSSRSLRNPEGNSITTNEEKMAEDKENNTDEENMAEDKENRRSSRRGLRNAEGNSVKTDTEYMADGKRNRRSSRSLRNAEGNSITTKKEKMAEDRENNTDAENMAEDKENRCSPKRNVCNAEGNSAISSSSVTTGEYMAEDTKNRRSTRRSERLQRQDAEEIVSLVSTRSRRKSAQTPAGENSKNTRSSRRNKNEQQ